MFKQILLGFIFFSSIIFGFSTEYYADVEIFVDETGKTSILGKTNYDDLIVSNSQKFTSKNGELWIFNLSVSEEFSNFIFELNLPSSAQTNYIKTTPNFRIAKGDDDNIKIIGTGENRELNILVQYSFEDLDNVDDEPFSYLGYYWSFFILGGVVFLVWIFRGVKFGVSKISEEISELESEKLDLDSLNLNDRQKEIIDILKEHGKISQKNLTKMMNIPKASVSRNVQSLSSRGVVEVSKSGITNFVSLKK